MVSMSFVDTETTGLTPGIHRVIEVAVARVDDNRWEDFLIQTYRIRPTLEDYGRGESRAYEVNGYRLGHPDWEEAPECDTPEATTVWGEIASLLHRAPVVGYNTSFDTRHMWAELAKHGVPRVGGSTPYDGDDIKGSPWEGHQWDVAQFSKALMKRAGRKGWKLSVVYEELCKGPPLPPHRAEADVLRTLWVLADGRKAFPDMWPDVVVNEDAIKEAVTAWSERRLRG